jgi:hypothetical protein
MNAAIIHGRDILAALEIVRSGDVTLIFPSMRNHNRMWNIQGNRAVDEERFEEAFRRSLIETDPITITTESAKIRLTQLGKEALGEGEEPEPEVEEVDETAELVHRVGRTKGAAESQALSALALVKLAETNERIAVALEEIVNTLKARG